MAYLEWEEELNTGIEEIDNQHQQIVGLINQLYDVCHAKTKDITAVKEIVNTLVDYTIRHFRLEEHLIKEAGYKDSISHAEKHKDFSAVILDYKERLSQRDDQVADKLLNLLYDWLFVHILHEDAGYVPTVSKFLESNPDYSIQDLAL